MARRKFDEDGLIFNLMARGYVALDEARHAVGRKDLASWAFESISGQFADAAAEAAIASYEGLLIAAGRFLKKFAAQSQQDERERAGGTQELAYGGQVFQYLNLVYMVARGDDSYAVRLHDLTADECQAIASRLEADAQTKFAEADEMRIFVQVKFGIEPEPPQADDSAVLEAPTP